MSRDSDTTLKVKRSNKGQLAGGGAYCGGLPHNLFMKVLQRDKSKTIKHQHKMLRIMTSRHTDMEFTPYLLDK